MEKAARTMKPGRFFVAFSAQGKRNADFACLAAACSTFRRRSCGIGRCRAPILPAGALCAKNVPSPPSCLPRQAAADADSDLVFASVMRIKRLIHGKCGNCDFYGVAYPACFLRKILKKICPDFIIRAK